MALYSAKLSNLFKSSSCFNHFRTFAKDKKSGSKCEESKKKEEAPKAPPPPPAPRLKTYKIYRYSPKSGKKPFLQSYTIDLNKCAGQLVLDVLQLIKAQVDPTLAYRRSCREGICGSCAMNIDGVNRLACKHNIKPSGTSIIYPLPHMYVIKDLVTDMKQFLNQHRRIRPYLISSFDKTDASHQIKQSIKDRDTLDGLVECILCACCSTSCPEYWWHGHSKPPKDFLGPAALLNAYRYIIDTRDEATEERLDELRNFYNVYRCHTINNCSNCCPQKLNPAKAIANIRLLLSEIKAKKPGDMSGGQPAAPNTMCD